MNDILSGGRPPRNGRKPATDMRFAPMRGDLQTDLLSEEEMEALRMEARAEVEREKKKRQSDAFYQKVLEDERRAGDPKYETVPIFLRLPGSANYIMLDGKQYFTDTVYNSVPQPVAAVLIEQMNRAWAHEEITEVRDSRGRRNWRPPPGIGFGNFMDNRLPRNLTLSTAEMDGAIAAMHRTVNG